MFARRGVRLLAVIIGVIALPSVVALAWYHHTNDPTLRPLGITKSALTEHENATASEVVAHLSWNRAQEAEPSDTFAQSLVQAFDIKQVDLRVIVTDNTGEATSVLFVVGASRIGPFPKDKAVKGVNAAIMAYHMVSTRPPNAPAN
ncbi:hypothetical protein GCM10016455_23430 [Aliiroseovarius zhejiangensis]|uniref:Secreted protein n=1 Tax=Aliiroseovarius zhejiangensis TaxID=1632025 RepID=A0ABQ3J263_9RHOB|nr:hypothetical protein [Aliiroseovarius zhejiangensis]GHF01730.1 hypothetical protein GCM10016455_23430 [Aliiroseovarius zhejiangensis]